VFGGISGTSPDLGDGRDRCKERAGLFGDVGKPYLAYYCFPQDPPGTSPGSLNGVLENGPDRSNYVAVC
jgi:hypothetical protein